MDAPVAFAGLSPGFIGLNQVNLVVPNLPPGDYLVQVTAGGVASNEALLTIQ